MEETKESPYNWLPSIKEGEQIIGGAKLRDGLIVPPKKEEEWPGSTLNFLKGISIYGISVWVFIYFFGR